VQSYASQVNAEIQKYTANEMNMQIRIWETQTQGAVNEYQAKANALLQEYGVALQAAVAEFNEDNAEYQADLQVKIQEAQNLQTAEREKVTADLQKYAQQLQQYQIDVNTEFQKYLQVSVAAEVTEWTTKRANLLDEYRVASQNVVAQQQAELTAENTKFQANLAKYAQDITGLPRAIRGRCRFMRRRLERIPPKPEL